MVDFVYTPQEDAVNYLYNIDFASSREFLESVGEFPNEDLRILLAGISGHPWVLEGVAEYSLDGARLIAKGDVASLRGDGLRCCDWFEEVYVYALSDSCTALHGNIVFHLGRKEIINGQ